MERVDGRALRSNRTHTLSRRVTRHESTMPTDDCVRACVCVCVRVVFVCVCVRGARDEFYSAIHWFSYATVSLCCPLILHIINIVMIIGNFIIALNWNHDLVQVHTCNDFQADEAHGWQTRDKQETQPLGSNHRLVLSAELMRCTGKSESHSQSQSQSDSGSDTKTKTTKLGYSFRRGVVCAPRSRAVLRVCGCCCCCWLGLAWFALVSSLFSAEKRFGWLFALALFCVAFAKARTYVALTVYNMSPATCLQKKPVFVYKEQ